MKLSDVSNEEKNRIRLELAAAGVTNYGLRKMESRYLPEIIHQGEHIKAVIYGLRNGFSGMLVATDQRIIYTERKPFYGVMDEIAYAMVSGVRITAPGQKAGVTLHTRVGDYTLKFVNKNAAHKFIEFIDQEHLKELRQI